MVDIEDTQDGVLAIRAFAEVIDKHGIACFTAIALTVDHLSPIRHYPFKERHMKAMYNVTGKKDAFNWALDEIQVACQIYDDLQLNTDLKELSMHKELLLSKMAEAEKEKSSSKKQTLLKELRDIRKLQKEVEADTDMAKIENATPVKNGYSLSRLEQKVINTNSFYHGESNKRNKKTGSEST